jgi:radical SAM superfamily enzyme YgiQ (UPF0313 family)
VHALLISTYELGRQPFGLASPAAWLRAAGVDVGCQDLSRTPLDEDAVRSATLVAFYLPMHTATRLAIPIIDRVRATNPAAHLCAYGLYAPLNASLLRDHGIATILGGEFEAELQRLACVAPAFRRGSSQAEAWHHNESVLPRLKFLPPDRSDLPPLHRYATLETPSGRRIVGYTEASRGCKHLCRHCPVVPVYNGQFRIVSPDVVLADIGAQVAAGAEHITFGDPDFFNGVTHAMRVVRALAREFPGLTYDVTIKIEHLLRQAEQLPTLADTGCLFVTSAVESVDDRILDHLRKGHTRGDFERVVTLCRNAGVALTPTFVAFTPWTTIEGYCDLLDAIDDLDLVGQVAPIQLALRLLVCEGSRLLELEDIRRVTGPFEAASLVYPWTHADPRVDALQETISDLVGRRLTAARGDLFDSIAALAHREAGRTRPPLSGVRNRATIPYLNEPWYC